MAFPDFIAAARHSTLQIPFVVMEIASNFRGPKACSQANTELPEPITIKQIIAAYRSLVFCSFLQQSTPNNKAKSA